VTEKMNPEIKELWLQALTSGEYTQGTGYLQKDGSFCCLGVLCDLAVKAGVAWSEEKVWNGVSATTYRDYNGDNSTTTLPDGVAEWAEISASGQFSFEFGDTLWELNDNRKLTFEQIAAVIDEKF
jgi:hypothetical protein